LEGATVTAFDPELMQSLVVQAVKEFVHIVGRVLQNAMHGIDLYAGVS
jgi:hypothetical protein